MAHHLARVAERQTRQVQDLVGAIPWGFKSLLSHHVYLQTPEGLIREFFHFHRSYLLKGNYFNKYYYAIWFYNIVSN